MNQNKQILKYLKTHKRGITPLEAWTKFGCYRLSGRIFELRAMGHNIKTDLEDNPNNEGKHARYYLEG